MSPVDEAFAEAMAFNLGSGALPGTELVTYQQAEGKELSRSVKVIRGQAVQSSGGIIRTLPLSIYIARSQCEGVTSVNVGGDAVLIATNFGDIPSEHVVVSIMDSDAVGFLLELS